VQYAGWKFIKGAESFFDSISIAFFEETKKILSNYKYHYKNNRLFVGKHVLMLRPWT